MTTLVMGANAPVAAHDFTLDIHISQSAQIDVTALQLYADGKVRGDDDMCFYNQTSIGGGAISLKVDGDQHRFTFNLDKVGGDVEKIVVNAVMSAGAFSSVKGLKVTTSTGIDMPVETSGRTEAALILCEIYKRNNQWKFRNVSQGFNGGLQALAEHFGVEVAAPETPAPVPQPAAPSRPTPAPAAPAHVVPAPVAPAPAGVTPVTAAPTARASPVNLDKISLTKKESSISLKKDDARFGRIRVNLNWNKKSKTGGLFGMGKRGIDLDLGAFVEFDSGEFGVIQALGKTFGDLDNPPYVKLMGDDRTGEASEGEWLEINGDRWSSFRRILIFAFIYEGAANWQ